MDSLTICNIYKTYSNKIKTTYFIYISTRLCIYTWVLKERKGKQERMSYGITYDSSIKRTDSLSFYQSQLLEAEKEGKDTADIQVFNNDLLPMTGTEVEKEDKKLNRDFDISELVKKYKKNPADILKELNIGFSDEQKEKLAGIITDKKKLKAFLEIAQNEKLSANDIYSAMESIKNYKPSSWLKRVGNSIKTFFTDYEEFEKLAKSETVYYAGKLSENMGQIREKREDFTSEGTTQIATIMTKEPGIKDNVMHFVVKDADSKNKYYSEKDVTRAATFMSNNVKKADEYTQNAQEMEAKKKKKGQIKYTANTTLDVAERVTLKNEIKSATMAVAKKSDMTEEFLGNISKNLFDNPEMSEVVEYQATAKNIDNKDKFTAGNINSTSNELVNASSKYCATYTQTVKELGQNPKLSGSDINSIASDISKHPEIKDRVMEKIQNGNYTAEEIVKYSSQCAKEAQANNINDSAKTVSSVTVTNNVSSKESETTAKTSATNPIQNKTSQQAAKRFYVNKQENDTTKFKEQENEISAKVVTINGKSYDRDKVFHKLTIQFGTLAEQVLENLHDPAFLDVLKTYGSNKILLQAALEQPEVLEKLKSTCKLSKTDLAQTYEQCTNSTNTDIMLLALSTTKNAHKAIEITKHSKTFNLGDQTIDILNSSKDSIKKREELDKLYQTGVTVHLV